MTTTSTPPPKTGEHPATNLEVRRWSLAQLGALLGVLTVVLPAGWFAFKLMVGEALAQDGGHVTQSDISRVQTQVSELRNANAAADAGLRAEMMEMRAEQKKDLQRVEDKVDKLIDLMLKKGK